MFEILWDPLAKKKYCRLVGNKEAVILIYFRNEFSALKLTCLTSIDKSSFELRGHKTLPFPVGFLRFHFTKVTLNKDQKIYARVLLGQNNYSSRPTPVCLTKFP